MSNSKFKALFSILTAALLSASALTGCTGQGQQPPVTQDSETVTQDSETVSLVPRILNETSSAESTEDTDGSEDTPSESEGTETSGNYDVGPDYVPTDEDAFDGEIIGGSIEINSYTGKDTDVKIPKTLGGKPVGSIAPNTFTGNKKITSITIPAGIVAYENQGQGAFMDCTNLKSATIYCKNLTDFFFTNCTSLKTVTLGDSVKDISDYAFGGCTSLEEIVIPKEVNTIGNYAFGQFENSFTGENVKACTSLKKVVLGEETRTIGSSSFSGCTALKEINLDEVGYISDYAFLGCTSLPDLTITESSEGIKKSFGMYAFANCTAMKSVTFIPEKMNLSSSTKAFGYNVVLSDYEEAKETVRKDFVVYADKFTDGASYAKENGLTCKAR